MPAPIVIELTPQAQALIVKLRRLPQEIGQAIKRGMDSAGTEAQTDIVNKHFRGLAKKPYPVSEHRLRNISDRLQSSIFWKPATVETAGSSVSVTGTLGSHGVKYAWVHEYGFTGPVFVNSFFRKTKKGGRTLVAGHGAVMNIPARAPMRTGIAENKINFQQKIQEELEKTLNAKA